MALGTIDQFKSRLAGGGARGNLFQVTLSRPQGLDIDLDTETASFMCEGAQLPASTITPIELPFRGRIFKTAGDRTFEPWTISVINDINFTVRNAMEKWMSGIANHADVGGTQNPHLYFADLRVDQFDRDGETILKTYTIKDAWPSNISAIELNYSETEIEKFEVEFQYQYWTSDTTDE